ncbi:hypothetical protein TWF569_006437 [Orbilia oligospora]|nr:hypothetical protein TWF569_006437 [Orbilia oligospora]
MSDHKDCEVLKRRFLDFFDFIFCKLKELEVFPNLCLREGHRVVWSRFFCRHYWGFGFESKEKSSRKPGRSWSFKYPARPTDRDYTLRQKTLGRIRSIAQLSPEIDLEVTLFCQLGNEAMPGPQIWAATNEIPAAQINILTHQRRTSPESLHCRLSIFPRVGRA